MGQRSGTRMIRPEYDPDIRPLLSLSVVSVFRAWTKQDLETIYRIRLFSPLVYPVRYFLFFSPPILFTFSPVYLSIYLHFFRVFIYIFPASRSSYVAAIFTQGSRDGETRSIDGDTRRPGNEDEEGLREFTVSDSKMMNIYPSAHYLYLNLSRARLDIGSVYGQAGTRTRNTKRWKSARRNLVTGAGVNFPGA